MAPKLVYLPKSEWHTEELQLHILQIYSSSYIHVRSFFSLFLSWTYLTLCARLTNLSAN